MKHHTKCESDHKSGSDRTWSQIATLVDRKTRFTTLVRIPYNRTAARVALMQGQDGDQRREVGTGLDGAEAVLRLRALHGNGDLDAYFTFHLEQAQCR